MSADSPTPPRNETEEYLLTTAAGAVEYIRAEVDEAAEENRQPDFRQGAVADALRFAHDALTKIQLLNCRPPVQVELTPKTTAWSGTRFLKEDGERSAFLAEFYHRVVNMVTHYDKGYSQASDYPLLCSLISKLSDIQPATVELLLGIRQVFVSKIALEILTLALRYASLEFQNVARRVGIDEHTHDGMTGDKYRLADALKEAYRCELRSRAGDERWTSRHIDLNYVIQDALGIDACVGLVLESIVDDFDALLHRRESSRYANDEIETLLLEYQWMLRSHGPHAPWLIEEEPYDEFASFS